MIGAVSVPNASGNETEYEVWRYGAGGKNGSIPSDITISNFTNCDYDNDNPNLTCYGSANDEQVKLGNIYPNF